MDRNSTLSFLQKKKRNSTLKVNKRNNFSNRNWEKQYKTNELLLKKKM